MLVFCYCFSSKCEKILATGFEFGYAVTASYFNSWYTCFSQNERKQISSNSKRSQITVLFCCKGIIDEIWGANVKSFRNWSWRTSIIIQRYISSLMYYKQQQQKKSWTHRSSTTCLEGSNLHGSWSLKSGGKIWCKCTFRGHFFVLLSRHLFLQCQS